MKHQWRTDLIAREGPDSGTRAQSFRESVCLSCAHRIMSETPDRLPTVFCLLLNRDLPAGVTSCNNWADDDSTP